MFSTVRIHKYLDGTFWPIRTENFTAMPCQWGACKLLHSAIHIAVYFINDLSSLWPRLFKRVPFFLGVFREPFGKSEPWPGIHPHDSEKIPHSPLLCQHIASGRFPLLRIVKGFWLTGTQDTSTVHNSYGQYFYFCYGRIFFMFIWCFNTQYRNSFL